MVVVLSCWSVELYVVVPCTATLLVVVLNKRNVPVEVSVLGMFAAVMP